MAAPIPVHRVGPRLARMAVTDDDADKLIAAQKAGEEMLSDFVEAQPIKCVNLHNSQTKVSNI